MYRTQQIIKLDDTNANSLDMLFKLFVVYGGYELYLVGGCVRDFLLDRTPKDIDLCTNATPDQVKALLQTTRSLHTWDSGLKHGTLTITDDFFKTSYEITTYRIDGEYTDGRHPDAVTFTSSLEEDLKRRDFTVNSFAYNLLSNELFMLDETFMNDLELGILRTVGSPDERFQEDGLRMLRAIRFSAQLNYSINTDTLEAIKRNVALIKQVSIERIRDELTKIISSEHPDRLELLIVTGLHMFILPELEAMLNCKQHNRYHYTDVLHHTFDVMKNLPKENAALRWSALFHDMGKPCTLTVDDKGYEHFYGHALFSADKVKKYADAFKFDNLTVNYIYQIVKYHDTDVAGISKKHFKDLINKVGQEIFVDYLLFRQADALAHNLLVDEVVLSSVSRAKELFKEIRLYKDPMSVKELAINGHDVMQLGFIGKEVGVALSMCLEAVLENPACNTKELLLEILYNKKKES